MDRGVVECIGVMSDEGADEQREPRVLSAPGMHWYVLRVASNKEDRVRESLERKVAIEGLQPHVGRLLVPTVKERRMRGGHVKVSEEVWFTIKESSGVGDFIASGGKPIRMAEHDVAGMLAACEKSEEEPGLSGLDLRKGDVVKITEGSFENFEGEVDSVDQRRGMVTVILEVFGRATPVEVEYWQLEKM